MNDTRSGKSRILRQMGEKILDTIDREGYKIIIELAATESEVIEAKTVDDAAFGDNQGISLEELRKIMAFGALILMRLKENGRMIGHSQILFRSIEELPFDFTYPTGYCYGTGLLPEFQGRGLGKHLAYYQESIAREKGVTELFMTVRVENHPSLRLRLDMGYEIYDYKSDFYGPDISRHSRLCLKKGLVGSEIFPPKKETPINQVFIPVAFDKPVYPAIHYRISNLIKHGYQGIGINRKGLFFVKRSR